MLCDSAVSVEGKLYVQGGGWNVLTAGGMPFTAPRIGMVVLVEIPYGATRSRHQMTVELADEDGIALPLGPSSDSGAAGHLSLAFEAGRPEALPPGEVQLLPFALNIDGYAFTRAGGYAFVIAVDGEELTRVRFRVRLRAAPTPHAI